MSCWLRTINFRNCLRFNSAALCEKRTGWHSRCCSLTYSLQQMALLSVWRRAFAEWSHYCRSSLKSRRRCLRMSDADADFYETTPIKGLVSKETIVSCRWVSETRNWIWHRTSWSESNFHRKNDSLWRRDNAQNVTLRIFFSFFALAISQLLGTFRF